MIDMTEMAFSPPSCPGYLQDQQILLQEEVREPHSLYFPRKLPSCTPPHMHASIFGLLKGSPIVWKNT